MTEGRDPQIREAITSLAFASRPAPHFDALADGRSATPERSRQAWVVAVAVAVVTLVVIGVASMLFGGSDGSSVPIAPTEPTTLTIIDSITPAPPSPVSTTTSSPNAPTGSVESSIGVITWTSTEIPRELTNIRSVDGGFVARSIEEGPNGVEAEAVTSIDGLTWTPLESQPAWAGSYSDEAIQQTGVPWNVGFVRYEGGLLSLTAFTKGEPPVAEWLSGVDGQWSQVPIEPVSGIYDREVSFASGPAGAIIFAGNSDGRPLMWVLRDGQFELIDDPSIDALPIPDHSVPYTDAGLAGYLRGSRLHATESGFLAEFFIADDTGIVTDPPLRYQSTDGRDWMAVAGPDMEIWDTTVRDGLTMAVGDRGIRVTSDNGSTWSQPGDSDEPLSGTVDAGPLGWIMPAGQVGPFFDVVGIQISTDAINWETILQPDGGVTGMAMDETKIVVATAAGWENVIYRIWVALVTS
ncbi:hypothetical protein ACFLQ7_01860 [Actinomycetota bacterium]